MAELKIKADSGGGTVSLKGPATTTSNAAVQLTLPVDDGTSGQYLKTDGSGVLSWATVSASSDVVDDTTPQLGGNLDVNGKDITGDAIDFHAADGQVIAKLHKTNSSEFYFNNSKKLEVTNGGISVTGNVTPSSGIYLGGSGGSNHLNDYEKGSWDATCDNSVTLHDDELFYTKVGRLVHVCGYLRVNSDNSNSAFVINNLPFTANSGYGLSAPFCRLQNWNIDSDCKWVAGYTEANKIHFQQVKDDTSATALAADSSGVLILNVTYYQN